MPPSPAHPILEPDAEDLAHRLRGLQVFERGWLSSNNLLIHDPGGAVLVDSSHVLHAEQTLALVDHALAAPPEGCAPRLAAVLNTHLHSDHCGGNAALQRARPGLPVFVPAPSWNAVQDWNDEALSHLATGQRCERFVPAGTLVAGERLALGGRDWEVLGAPGHDPDSVMLFDHRDGVLVSADALWENGFGAVFPELEGEPGFDDVGAVLDLIEALPVRVVVPGHGRPFTDVAGALARARSRLATFQADPPRHLRHGAKVLLKYHLLEERSLAVSRLMLWIGDTPLMRKVWQELGRPQGSVHAWGQGLLDDLVASGVARLEGGRVLDA